MSSAVTQLQRRARQLYRELHHLGRDYDLNDNQKFSRMLRKCFGARIGLRDGVELKAANEKAEYIVKELEALCASDRPVKLTRR